MTQIVWTDFLIANAQHEFGAAVTTEASSIAGLARRLGSSVAEMPHPQRFMLCSPRPAYFTWSFLFSNTSGANENWISAEETNEI